MKKLFQRAAALTALSVLSLFPAPVSLAAPATNNHAPLRIFEHYTNYREVNIFKGKDKRGNYEVFNDPVYDETGKKLIGHSSGSCIYTTNTVTECSWSIIFSDGSLSFEGVEPVNEENYTNAVTGGTGVYKGARGQAKIHGFTTPSGVEVYEYKIELE